MPDATLQQAEDAATGSYPVVIVGAGPVGLALAIELGGRGVRCLVVERNDRVGYAPRAKTTNVRTRTHLRRWGIAQALADASPFGVDYPSDVVFVTRLGGRTLTRIANASNCDPARDALYPEHGQWIPQYRLEEVMLAHARTLPGVAFRFRTEFEGAEQDEEGVCVRLRSHDGEAAAVRCDYLVGADGAGSLVRKAIGAVMTGDYGISRNYNIVFRAPGLSDKHPHGPGIMYWQVDPKAPSLIGPMDRDDVWFIMPTRLPPGQTIEGEAAARFIRDATGIDADYEILSHDEWVASRLIADRYSRGRIYLAGDACHLHPPFGGFGMNMGVSDGVDLGWKLAATLQGWGGPRLLESYEPERRPVHEQVIAEAVANHAVLSNDLWSEGLDLEGPSGDERRAVVGRRIAEAKTREFRTLGTVLGVRYSGSPILPPAAEAPPPSRGDVYTPCAQPGCLAPHAWLGDGDSLYDHFGPGLTLLAGGDADGEVVEGLRRDAEGVGAPFTVLQAPAPDIYPAAYTLVRPDQHVGWSGDTPPPGLIRRLVGWAETVPQAAPTGPTP